MASSFCRRKDGIKGNTGEAGTMRPRAEKSGLIIIGCVCFFIVSTVLTWNIVSNESGSTERGGLIAQQTNLDFGKTDENKELEKTLFVKNTTKNDIQIIDFITTCGCTTSDGVVGRIVRAESQVGIPVSLSTYGKKGHFRGTLTVGYRNTSEARAQVHYLSVDVRANVSFAYKLDQTAISVRQVKPLCTYRSMFVMTPGQRMNPDLVECFASSPYITVRKIEATAARIRFEVSLSVPTASVLETTGYQITDELVLRYAGKPLQGDRVMFYADVEKPIKVLPESIVILPSYNAAAVRRTVVLKSIEPFTLRKIVAHDDRLKILETRTTSSSATLLVDISDDPRKEPLRSELTVMIEWASPKTGPSVVRIPITRLRSALKQEK